MSLLRRLLYCRKGQHRYSAWEVHLWLRYGAPKPKCLDCRRER